VPDRAIDQPHAQAARIDALGNYEALAPFEVEDERDLPRYVAVHTHGPDDSSASRDWWELAGNLTPREYAAVPERLQLHPDLRSFAGWKMGYVPNRAVELNRQIDLVLVIRDLHDIDETSGAWRRPDLTDRDTRQQDTE
jgi:hypothetical protein